MQIGQQVESTYWRAMDLLPCVLKLCTANACFVEKSLAQTGHRKAVPRVLRDLALAQWIQRLAKPVLQYADTWR
eukprot:7753644-Karenia_brevis.AAC.1